MKEKEIDKPSDGMKTRGHLQFLGCGTLRRQFLKQTRHIKKAQEEAYKRLKHWKKQQDGLFSTNIIE